MSSQRLSRLAGPALIVGGLLWVAASIASVIIGMLTGKVDPPPDAHSPALVYIGIWFLPLAILSLGVGLLGVYIQIHGHARVLSTIGVVLASIGLVLGAGALISIVASSETLNGMFGGFGSFATIIGTGFLGWAALRASALTRWVAVTLLIMGFVTVPFIFVTPLPVGPAWATDMLGFFLSGIVYMVVGAKILTVARKATQQQARLSTTI